MRMQRTYGRRRLSVCHVGCPRQQWKDEIPVWANNKNDRQWMLCMDKTGVGGGTGVVAWGKVKRRIIKNLAVKSVRQPLSELIRLAGAIINLSCNQCQCRNNNNRNSCCIYNNNMNYMKLQSMLLASIIKSAATVIKTKKKKTTTAFFKVLQ